MVACMSQSLAELLKAARTRQALSLEEVARRADLSYRTVWNAEQGGMVPRGKTLRALADALDLDVADLVEEVA